MSAVQEPPIQEMTAASAPLNLGRILQQMLEVSEKVSDLIFSPGRPPQVELVGKLQPVLIAGVEKLSPAQTFGIAKLIIGENASATEALEKFGSADLSFSIPGLSRFRVNIFKQRGTHAIVMRVIPPRPPRFEDFDLPPQLREIVELKNGVVLVTGPTGSGKSSTLAAIIGLINETKFYHIVTIEDPIEFLHMHDKSTIHQRELHSDTPDFALALRAALRQAPKVILVGEMRDRETMEIALEAAETGHLVLSTLHTIDASKTVERIVTTFLAAEQSSVRSRLAKTLRHIISQRLIPRKDGGRVAIVEVFKNTPVTTHYLECEDPSGGTLLEALKNGASEGMQHFDAEIEKLVRAEIVDLETVLNYATDPQQLRRALSP